MGYGTEVFLSANSYSIKIKAFMVIDRTRLERTTNTQLPPGPKNKRSDFIS